MSGNNIFFIHLIFFIIFQGCYSKNVDHLIYEDFDSTTIPIRVDGCYYNAEVPVGHSEWYPSYCIKVFYANGLVIGNSGGVGAYQDISSFDDVIKEMYLDNRHSINGSGGYKIVNDSIYIQYLDIYSNQAEYTVFLKGKVLNDTTFVITEFSQPKYKIQPKKERSGILSDTFHFRHYPFKLDSTMYLSQPRKSKTP